jgi:hypothetical protein
MLNDVPTILIDRNWPVNCPFELGGLGIEHIYIYIHAKVSQSATDVVKSTRQFQNGPFLLPNLVPGTGRI